MVNAAVLKNLTPFWQKIFMTVGIFIAVFAVRFALPIFIVQLTSGMGFTEVVSLAINDSGRYAAELTSAGPIIESFGGTFLLMIAISYFLDHEKDNHWIGIIERRLAPLGRFDNIATFMMIISAIVIYFTVAAEERNSVFIAAVIGIALHMGLDLFGSMFENDGDTQNIKQQTGMAALGSVMYLEVLDASFSFDGVIGAFAITSSIILIMIGLGVGAIWVRSMTVHLVRSDTLASYRYLENGAHWAILALGLVMIGKLYGIEPPEWATGLIGLIFILLAILSSVAINRRESKAVVLVS